MLLLLAPLGCLTATEAPPPEEGLPAHSQPTLPAEDAGTTDEAEDERLRIADGELAETPTPPAPPPPDAGAEPPTEPPQPPDAGAAEPPMEEPGPPADCPRVQVVNTGGDALNVRPDPSTSQAPLAVLSAGSIVEVLTRVDGQVINGNATWFQITNGTVEGFISAAFAACIAPGSAPPDAFLLPLPCGTQVRVTQGNNSAFSHNGASAYAFDFGVANNTPLLAMKDAVVIAVDESTQPGDPCYSGGDSSCINEANGVTLRHPDGTTTLYAHVNSVEVSVGQHVPRGAVVALSGGTGWSTGPHAHVQRQTDCGYAFCQSIAMRFHDVPGDGVPVGGQTVVSQNGCQ